MIKKINTFICYAKGNKGGAKILNDTITCFRFSWKHCYGNNRILPVNHTKQIKEPDSLSCK